MKIVAAAIKRGESILIGRRHCEIIKDAVNNHGWKRPIKQKEQGFISESGKYFDRATALICAQKAGQLPHDFGRGYLISEDLW